MTSKFEVGLVIVGDEILSGKTLDTNSQFISKELSTRGVDVREINTIEDEIGRGSFSNVFRVLDNIEEHNENRGATIMTTHDEYYLKSKSNFEEINID